MEAVAFVVKCRTAAPCGKWTAVPCARFRTRHGSRQKRRDGESGPVEQPWRWTAGGQTPLDGSSRGSTDQPVARALIRQNVTMRHDETSANTIAHGLVMRRSRVRIPKAARGPRPAGRRGPGRTPRRVAGLRPPLPLRSLHGRTPHDATGRGRPPASATAEPESARPVTTPLGGTPSAAVGAFAWSAPTVGFLFGVAVHPRARKHGFGRQICGFLVTEALRIYGAAALIVDDWNRPALRLYEGMGMQYRSLSAAAIRSPRVTSSDTW
jgi:GNAT superfamily N-acetyltransferase